MDTPKDKRVKREIANSNERRRMQSINAGFQKLRRLLPVNDGEKLSKAAILQHASEFIQQIQRDKLILHEHNTLFRGIFLDYKNGTDISTAIENIDSLPIIPTTTNNINNNNNNIDNNNTDSNSSNNTTSTTTATATPTTTTTITTNATPLIVNQTDTIVPTTATSTSTATTTTSTTTNTTTTTTTEQLISRSCETISDTVATASPKNGLVSSGVAKAAIALPLEVPYISETAIKEHHHHHLHHYHEPLSTNARKMLKTDPTTTNDPQNPATKGQTLDTICKAIMEIEGDRVFTNENIKHEQGTT